MGSLSDPKETPGLAHFCEHMLFYASAKYPEEDSYSKYIVRPGPFLRARVYSFSLMSSAQNLL